MNGGVVVTMSAPVIVVPSELEPATLQYGDTVTLSSFDKCVVPFPVTALLVFDRPIHEPAETVKKALARALAHYRPIAGRLAAGADGEVCLACTDEGVTFVAASATCALGLEELATSAAVLKGLAVYYPGDICGDADPLLLVQVTEFSCGGFVVGVSWNHIVADGAGMGQFLEAFGELARGVSPPSVAPVRRWDDTLPGLPPSMVAAQKSTMSHEPQDLAYLDVTVPASLIGRIKAESGGTVYEAVTAVLWKCRTRAAMSSSSQGEVDSNPESLAPLAFPCNMRAHAGAGDGYYGNCVTVQTVPATRAAVAASSISDLVRLIRRAKEKAPDILSSSCSSSSVNGNGDGVAEEQPQLGWYDAVAVVSWHNLGFDAADFGSGAPARVMWYGERNVVPGCVVCPSGNGGKDDGVRVSSIFVKPEHVDAFLGELEGLAAST
ncbi:10-deacetylbaccatin III 10-O-acetyltransferase [Dichanthelium oligosanthes]|uniref:10-deacetylbaccatin III 10-O-acetyltransferase n=1 Tax=Dichanthelium oligosanthes TaxID=888268 RepID=A0A1E5VGS3_9POAL|nr:10-deacetylbaccatin III 10-O-acetyltransferase [Dichanthelium oligosanthes]